MRTAHGVDDNDILFDGTDADGAFLGYDLGCQVMFQLHVNFSHWVAFDFVFS